MQLYIYTATISKEAESAEEAESEVSDFVNRIDGRDGFGVSLEESEPEVQEVD